jgi:hypothetical protein
MNQTVFTDTFRAYQYNWCIFFVVNCVKQLSYNVIPVECSLQLQRITLIQIEAHLFNFAFSVEIPVAGEKGKKPVIV